MGVVVKDQRPVLLLLLLLLFSTAYYFDFIKTLLLRWDLSFMVLVEIDQVLQVR